MAYDGWLVFNDTELVNLSRTAQLAEMMGATALWTQPSDVSWIEDALAGEDYDDITTAPWYNAGYPASMEFAGVVPLSMPGLDDSALERSGLEYIGDGGNSGAPRNGRLVIVAKVSLIASTDRGAEYGKRWLDRVLRGGGPRNFCAGSDLRYFRYPSDEAPVAHRRDVSLTRGAQTLSKRKSDCSVVWNVSFTLTADDSYEYGEAELKFANLGSTPSGGDLTGSLVLTESSCPQYDYSPIYDPLYPALVPSPTAPDFYPAGWSIVPGATFERFWARITPVEPTSLLAVPEITLTAVTEARMVRVSLWPSDSAISDQCDPLFSVVVTYLPPGVQFVISGELKASYLWDGLSPAVRRTDSLVYGPDAKPVQWTAFNDPMNLLVTLDIFTDSDGYEGDGSVRAEIALIPKSD